MAKKKSPINWGPLRRLMKAEGANIVAREAVDILLKELQKRAEDITKDALFLAKRKNRRKITAADINDAIFGPHPLIE